MLEELGVRAFPASEAVTRQGWLLRSTPPVLRRRCNSAINLSNAEAGLDDIAAVEDFYASRQADAVFHVTPERDTGLDATLAERGYGAEAHASVMTAPMASVTSRIARLGEALPGAALPDVQLHATRREAWTAAAMAFEPRPDAQATFDVVVERIDLPKVFAHVRIGPADTGVGIGVLDGSWLGLSAIATHVAHRRRGVAREVIRAVTTWGAAARATHVWLQVERENTAARALYAALGFTDACAYHYRRLPARRAG